MERSLARLRARALRKPPLSLYTTKHSDTSSSSLKKVLNAFDLTFMGIGGIIGAGVFVLTGTAARQEAGCASFDSTAHVFALQTVLLYSASLPSTVGLLPQQ